MEYDSDGAHWEFPTGTFPHLKAWSWSDESVIAGTTIFQNPPPKLEELTFSVFEEPPDNSAIGVFVTSLVGAFQNIRSVHLNLFTDVEGQDEIRVFESLESLLQCKQLEALVIHDSLGMAVWEGDVIRMAEAWPNLRKLILAPDPIDATELAFGSPITLLSVFARLFGSKVEELGWYVNKSNANDILDLMGTATLPALHTLDVGTSNIDVENTASYAAFLLGICPPDLIIRAGECSLSTPFTDSREPSTWQSAVNETKKLWTGVEQQVKAIHRCQRPLRYQLELASRIPSGAGVTRRLGHLHGRS